MEECRKALEPFGENLLDLIMNGSEDSLKSIVAPFICIAAVQVGCIIFVSFKKKKRKKNYFDDNVIAEKQSYEK